MNQKSGLFILVGVILLYNSCVEASKEMQMVIRLPEGAWDGQCGIATQMRIRENCNRIKSTIPEEQIACSLFNHERKASPNIPFGMYPPDLKLDSEISTIPYDGMTEIFDRCTMMNMINDGCFTFQPDTWHGAYTTSSYLDSEEYTRVMDDSFGFGTSIGVAISYGSLNAAYKHQSHQTTTESNMDSTAQVSRTWQHNIGILSMQTCVPTLMKYFNSNYRDKLKSAYKAAQGQGSSDYKKDLDSIVSGGSMIPTAFQYAIKYSGVVNIQYSGKETSNKVAMSDVISVGLTAKYKNIKSNISVSASMEDEMIQEAKRHKLQIVTKSTNYIYGKCNFFQVLLEDASRWSVIMEECAKNVHSDFSLLTHAASIATGGFTSIYDVFDSPFSRQYFEDVPSGGVARAFLPAVRNYFSYCSCLDNKKFFLCYKGDGAYYQSGAFSNNDACTYSFFWEREPPKKTMTVLSSYKKISHYSVDDEYAILYSENYSAALMLANSRLYVKKDSRIIREVANLSSWPVVLKFEDGTGTFSMCAEDEPSKCIIKSVDPSKTTRGPFLLTITNGGAIQVLDVTTGAKVSEF